MSDEIRTEDEAVPDYYCTFCGDGRLVAKYLVAGPGKLCICNNCVVICVKAMLAGTQPTTTKETAASEVAK